MSNLRGGPPSTEKIQLPLPAALYAFLRFHAVRRNVTVQEMIRCVMTSWVRRVTPRDDPIFALHSIGYYMPPPLSDERYYPGFIASLRFQPEADVPAVSVNEPPARTSSELWPSQK